MGSEIAGLGGLTGGGFDPGPDLSGTSSGFDRPGSGAMMDSGSDPDYTGMSGTSTTTTPAPTTSTINDSTLVEMMLSEETPIIDEESRNNFSFDELDFIDSPIPPNKYAYATTYYTTFYVRNYSYNWNANSYLSVDINGKVTDIYADTYETVRMDYYPPEAPAENVVDVIKFHVDDETTKTYKSFERGNYIVWDNNDELPSLHQPYSNNGLLYINDSSETPSSYPEQTGLAYATVSKNLKFILDPETTSEEITAIRQWWLNSYFTYVANIWSYTGSTNVFANTLVNINNDEITALEGNSIVINDIPEATGEYVLICGNFGILGEKCTITVVADPADAGTVTGGGRYDVGTDNVTITADANEGYIFDHWNDGDRNASREITVIEDCIYTAYFMLDNTRTITVESSNGDMGTVSGGGTYIVGATATIEATAEEYYKFVRWDDDGEDNADNPRTITVENNATYTAIFEMIEYLIQVAYSPDLNRPNDNDGNIYIIGGDPNNPTEGLFTFKDTAILCAIGSIDIDNNGTLYKFSGWRVNDDINIIAADINDSKWSLNNGTYSYRFEPKFAATYYAVYVMDDGTTTI